MNRVKVQEFWINAMHMRTRQSFLMSLLLCFVITACDGLPPQTTRPAVGGEVIAQGPQATGRTPEDTLMAFMQAWSAQDIDSMYALISSRSREIFPFAEFQQEYSAANAEMGFAGATYEIDTIRLQGETAAIAYNATIASNTFGEIEDNGRIMRFVQERNGWQVAWTPMDILNGVSSSVRLTTTRNFPPRANIYDRDLQPLVDEDGTIVTLRLRKLDMSNEEDCITLLSEISLRPRARVAALFANFLPDSVFNAGEFDVETFNTNRGELNRVCGVNVEVPNFPKVLQNTGRNYYGHGIAAHVTGYVGRVPVDGNGNVLPEWTGFRTTDIVGLDGIEQEYQSTLAGTPEQVLRLIEPSGQVIRELGGTSSSEPTPVVLTIDRDLQEILARALYDAFGYAQINWGSVASGAAAVVIDVNTGEILGLASYPTFEPRYWNPENTYYNSGEEILALLNDAREPLENKAVAAQYAPGSVFKIITDLAAVGSGVWQPDAIFDCQLTWDGSRFGDALNQREDWRLVFEREPAGPVTAAQALTTSCNPFFWEVAGLMWRENPNIVANYAQLLGIGQTTGIGASLNVPEARGNAPIPNNATAALNNAIGQGDTQVTAIQMARVVMAVANGGTLYQPYIVRQVGGLDGTELVEQAQPLVLSELEEISPEAFAVVREGMCQVTLDSNLGTAYDIFETAPYSSCGKTGSAQAGNPDSRTPPHSWYVSFAPADNPQIATVVVVPTSREGSDVAAPITRRILDQYFNAPVAPFPQWWEEPYQFVPPPAGVSGGAAT